MAKEEDRDEKPDDAKEEGGAEGEKGEGADGEGGEEGLHPPKKKLSKKMMIIIAAAAFVLLVGGGAGLYFAGVFGGGEPAAEGAAHDAQGGAEEGSHDAEAKHGDAEKAEGEGEAHVAPVFFPLGDVLVNLSGDGKRPNFLKIKVNLELADEKDAAALEALKPRIIDHFQIYLRELRVEDLRGSAGLYRLREELLLRVTEAVKPIRVRDVLFQEMLVQ